MADSGSGFQVNPDDIQKFADYINNTTVPEINTAADGVTNANKADVDAFGVLLGQTMGIPSRIAMAAVASQLKSLSQKMTGVASDTKSTATNYTQNESNVSTNFKNIQGG